MGKGDSGTKRDNADEGSPQKGKRRSRRRRGRNSHEESQAISPASEADDADNIVAPPRTRSTAESDPSALPVPPRKLWISEGSTCLLFGLSNKYKEQGHIMCDQCMSYEGILMYQSCSPASVHDDIMMLSLL